VALVIVIGDYASTSRAI